MKIDISKCIKFIFGVDVSKDDLQVCFAGIDAEKNIRIIKQASFKNNLKGYQALLQWGRKLQPNASLLFVMEATGVYYESLAYFLHHEGQQVSVQLPTKTKHYAKSLTQKSKTDKIDAAMLCRFGLERKIDLWKPASPVMQQLKRLTREHDSCTKSQTVIKNQLHALEASYQPLKSTVKRLNKQLKFIGEQIKEIEQQVKEVLQNDPVLYERVKKIMRVKGVGLMTVVTVVAETNGFALVQNVKQLTSYAGLDIVFNESGAKKGRTTISKKGNSRIRGQLYCPAMSARRWNPHMKAFYQRIMQRHTCKNVGIVAIERKLLVLIYSLWRSGQEYDPNRTKTKIAPPMVELHEMNETVLPNR